MNTVTGYQKNKTNSELQKKLNFLQQSDNLKIFGVGRLRKICKSYRSI